MIISKIFSHLWCPDDEWQLAAACVMIVIKFWTAITFYAVNLQAMETYPTCLRQTGISIGVIFSNAFGVFGPYIAYLVSSSLLINFYSVFFFIFEKFRFRCSVRSLYNIQPKSNSIILIRLSFYFWRTFLVRRSFSFSSILIDMLWLFSFTISSSLSIVFSSEKFHSAQNFLTKVARRMCWRRRSFCESKTKFSHA